MLLLWSSFVLMILLFLALDLGVFNRRPHAIGTGEALAWTVLWVTLALVFGGAVYYLYEGNRFGVGTQFGYDLSGKEAALLYITAYVTEKSLSLDNIFVIALIFTYFGVPLKYQHRVLFWGVIGALVLRGIMIAAGAALIHQFEWVTYVFGAFLLLTAVKLLIARHDNLEPEKNIFVRFIRKHFRVTEGFHEGHFFVQTPAGRAMTPLFLVLVLVESTDVLFAVDSVPAVFAITSDPFIVFTSNVFAILGLRSLYFALAAVMDKFRYLKMSLVFLLAYVGVKMLLAHTYPIPAEVSLAMIAGILGVGVLASLTGQHRDTARLRSPIGHDIERLVRVTWHEARRIVVIVFGVALLLIGAAMLVLPGPGIVVILFGLAVLSTHFVWARRFLQRAKHEVDDARRRVFPSSTDHEALSKSEAESGEGVRDEPSEAPRR